MKKLFLVFISILFTFNCFAQSQKEDISKKEDLPSAQICSSKNCYTLVKELGEGFFGKVYAAENSSGQTYAIKMYKLHSDFFDHPFANAEREYEQGVRLNHANILKPVELFKLKSPEEENETTYLVLEFIDGSTVYDIPKKSLFPNQALNSALQLVDALRYALSQELVHTDLHAFNVMLTRSSDIRVIDLASFYSFDEIIGYAEKEINTHSITNQDNKNDEHSLIVSQPLRQKNLKQFFMQHPQLLKKMQVVKGELKKNNKQSHLLQFKERRDSVQKLMLPTLSHYFDRITEICTDLIMKSNLRRAEKIRMRIAIKAAAWNYLEDSEENLLVPIDFYFDQLINILQS